MRVSGRRVLSLGLVLVATGCLPSSSVSVVPTARMDLSTVAEEPGSRASETPRAPAQRKAVNKKVLIIGAVAAALIVGIILLSGGDDDHSPGLDEARIR